MPEMFGAVRDAEGARDDRPNEDIRYKDTQSHDHDTKLGSIRAACVDPHNVPSLINLATSIDGLCNDESRKLACMHEQITGVSFRN